jgi:hypothetical protein
MDERGVDLPDQDPGLWSAVEHLVRLFRLRRADAPALVSAVCSEAVRLVDTVQHAGVISPSTGGTSIVAATGPIPSG